MDSLFGTDKEFRKAMVPEDVYYKEYFPKYLKARKQM